MGMKNGNMRALDDNEKIEKEFDRMIPEYTSNLFCIYQFAKELCFKIPLGI
jgi:hypothetical protein